MLRLSTGGLSPAAFQPKLRSKAESTSSWQSSSSSAIKVAFLFQVSVPFSAGGCENHCSEESDHWQLHLFNPTSGTDAVLRISKDLSQANLMGIIQNVQAILPTPKRWLENTTGSAVVLVKFNSGHFSFYQGSCCLGNLIVPNTLLDSSASSHMRNKADTVLSSSTSPELRKADPGADLASYPQFGKDLLDTFPVVGWASSCLLTARLIMVSASRDAANPNVIIPNLRIIDDTQCLDELWSVYQDLFIPNGKELYFVHFLNCENYDHLNVFFAVRSPAPEGTDITAHCFWSKVKKTLRRYDINYLAPCQRILCFQNAQNLAICLSSYCSRPSVVFRRLEILRSAFTAKQDFLDLQGLFKSEIDADLLGNSELSHSCLKPV